MGERTGWWVLSLAGAALLVSACGSASAGSEEGSAGPVVVSGKDMHDAPAAGMSGPLDLAHGCLQLRGDVAVWPKGPTWDNDAHAVVPDGGGSPIPVGSTFSGSGAVYDSTTDFGDLFGSDAAARIGDCLDASGADGVRLLIPRWVPRPSADPA